MNVTKDKSSLTKTAILNELRQSLLDQEENNGRQ
jgi:hypothetical protein